MDSYYALLELTPSCSDVELKKQYHKMSLKMHPDKGGDAQQFQQMKQAYELLSDKDKRKKYDMFGVDLDEGEEDDKLFVAESTELLTFVGAFAARTLFAGIFLVMAQYSICLGMLTLGSVYFVFVQKPKPEEAAGHSVLSTEMITLAVLGWLSLWVHNIFWWLLELRIQLHIFSFLAQPNITYDSQFAIKCGFCGFVAWWFSGRISYYLYSLIFEAVAAFVIYLFFEMSRAIVKATVEMKLKKYSEKIRESVATKEAAMASMIAAKDRIIAQKDALIMKLGGNSRRTN
jgi:hypothetical protein